MGHDTTFYAALTSDYVYRGISNSDENPAVHLGVDVSTEMGFFGGLWSSTTDITTVNRNRDREVDYYVGYIKYFDNDWSASISVNRYTYPGATGNVNYDYSEITGIVGYDDRVWIEFNYSDAIFGHDAASRNLEVQAHWPLSPDYSLATGVGYFDVSDFTGRAYTYWQLAVSRQLGWATLDLRYHDTSSAAKRISAGKLADPRLVATISAAF